jgi:hypothetical protein
MVTAQALDPCMTKLPTTLFTVIRTLWLTNIVAPPPIGIDWVPIPAVVALVTLTVPLGPAWVGMEVKL